MKKFSDLKTGTRLFLGFGLILLIILVMSGVALKEMFNLSQLTDKMYNHPLTVSQELLHFSSNLMEMERHLRNGFAAQTLLEKDEQLLQLQIHEQLILENLSVLENQFLGEKDIIIALQDDFQKLHIIQEDILDNLSSGDLEAANELLDSRYSQQISIIQAQLPYLIDFAGGKAVEFHQRTLTDFSNAVFRLLSFLTAAIVFSIFISIIITRSIRKPLVEIMKVVDLIASGDLSGDIQFKRSDEIGALGVSLRAMQLNLKYKAEIASKIAQEEFDVEIRMENENDEVALAINRIAENFARIKDRESYENWIRDGQNSLTEKIQGETELESFSDKAITFLVSYSGAAMGAFYLYQLETESLNLTGSYAFEKRKGLSSSFSLKEGIVGQAAYEQNIISLTDLPEDYFRIQSGMGSAVPRNVIALPLVTNEGLQGVVEMASYEVFPDKVMDFLKNSSEMLSISLQMIRSRKKVEALLAETQEQTVKMQIQQEELKQTNEELETQTKALKESQARLQAQQEELRVTNEELEERSRALEKQKNLISDKNTDLEKAWSEIEQKAADLEIASKYKSEFLANMSHELRTPLNSILILSELLKKNSAKHLDDKEVQYVSTIHTSGSDLLNLINDVLDLSKIEAGKMELQLDDVSIKDLLDEIDVLFSRIAEEKGIAFTIVKNDGIPESIHSDALRIKQILKNLISNSLKFTEKGGIEVSAGVTENLVGLIKSNSGKCFYIQVKDTGIGIPQEKQNSIFEAFQQGDGSISRKYGGTGLGLTISRELSHMLGGSIHLDKSDSNGTVFKIYLPLSIDRSAAIESASAKELRNRQTASGLVSNNTAQVDDILDDRAEITAEDKSLLIVDDDSAFSEILSVMAKERGFKVLLAPDGEMGLHLADYYQPSAIILDIGLPGIDGWTVLDRLKSRDSTRHIPIHFISATDQTRDALRKGAIGFQTKPVSVKNLENSFSLIEEELSKNHKSVLIVEDDRIQRQAIKDLIQGQDIVFFEADTAKDALKIIKENPVDCIILDLGLSGGSGFSLLKKLKKEHIENIPVIIYTGKDLTKEEEEDLSRYADSIIVKGARSPERLLDETMLFLHLVESQLSEKSRKAIRSFHEKENVFLKKTALLVDDDIRNIFALTSLLEDKGMNVLVARNGLEALQKLKDESHPDIVLMDIMMPEMDGYEAIRRIRKDDRLKSLPIIALTAKAMRGDRQKCIDAGATDYISKPVDTEKLLSLLRVWLYR